MEISGVPESITRKRLIEVLASLGIDAKDLTRHGGVTINGDEVRAELFARNAEGKCFVAPGGSEAARYVVTIPVKD